MRLYTVADVTEMFQISKPSVYKLINAGELYTVDIFGTKFRQEVLEDFVRRKEQNSNKDTFNYTFIPFKEATPLLSDIIYEMEKREKMEQDQILKVARMEDIQGIESVEDVKKLMVENRQIFNKE